MCKKDEITEKFLSKRVLNIHDTFEVTFEILQELNNAMTMSDLVR